MGIAATAALAFAMLVNAIFGVMFGRSDVKKTREQKNTAVAVNHLLENAVDRVTGARTLDELAQVIAQLNADQQT